MLYLNDDIAHFDFEAALPLLSEQRREQALKFKHEQGRKTCAAAYLLLCEGLRKEYGITEKPVFEYGEHGKPSIIGHPDIHFNFSHCREAAVCVISDRPVGVDIESIREYKESLVRYTMKLSGEGLRNDMKSVLTGQERIETHIHKEKNIIYSVIFD